MKIKFFSEVIQIVPHQPTDAICETGMHGFGDFVIDAYNPYKYIPHFDYFSIHKIIK